ncbi:MAG: hypothetical protein IPM57_12350 [Oligoflexia bacterium]|nr:hypothetical protein [Oligoflexia bacterium]
MKTLFYMTALILNLFSIQALAQPNEKPKVTVIKFTDAEREQKVVSNPKVKSAAIKQNFEASKLDSEILSLEDELDKGVVYIQ